MIKFILLSYIKKIEITTNSILYIEPILKSAILSINVVCDDHKVNNIFLFKKSL